MLGDLLRCWVSDFGYGEVTAGSVISGSSLEFMGILRRALGPNRSLDSLAVHGWLVTLSGREARGLVLLSREHAAEIFWRVEMVVGSEEPAPVTAPYSLPPSPPPLGGDATPAEMLASNIRQSLRRQAELLNLSIDPDDPKTNRLIADVANQTLNAGLRAQETVLAAKRDGNRLPSPRLLAAIEVADKRAEEDRASEAQTGAQNAR